MHLVVGKEEIIASEHVNGAFRAPLHHGERGQIARRYHHVHEVGGILQHAVDDAVDGRFDADVVVVVEDEDERPFNALQDLVDEQVGAPLGEAEQVLIRFGEVIEDGVAEGGYGGFDPAGHVA